jgi:hypothetical protein
MALDLPTSDLSFPFPGKGPAFLDLPERYPHLYLQASLPRRDS